MKRATAVLRSRCTAARTLGVRWAFVRPIIASIAVVVLGAACASTPAPSSALSSARSSAPLRAAADLQLETDAQYSHTGRRRDRAPVATLTVRDETFTLTTAYTPGLRVSGIVDPRATAAGTRLYVTAVELFANWANGWTELHVEASGVLLIRYGTEFGPVHWRAVVEEPIELWNATAGEIRYFDTYLLSDDGLRRATARRDRLDALVAWLREDSGPPYRDRDEYDITDAVWQRVARDGVHDEVPEWLQTLRDSGSLERDLREASGMLLALYNLDYVNGQLLKTVHLKER